MDDLNSMTIFDKVQAGMPEGRHRMIYLVEVYPYEYEIHFNEVVEYFDSFIDIPEGILTGIRPTFVNRIGGCYEIAFDLVSNIESGRSFAPPDSNNAHKLSTIIDQAIVRHYTKHKPYCYMFLAYSPELSRLYTIAMMRLRQRFKYKIKQIHSNLEPEGRGYVIEL
ncbi:hypothetical protein HA49_05430 [Tatumella morbirosei]|uniref:Uncharacterized protein n=1 Tax=Tatumella morbirosei TaxID=642227 RepID=A0A095VJF1_9GAMM|nr:hypothetical protein [Tatumella morbirosei]KGD74760.1 hypothetical protein HA49_05430 [Tatumella morbirosei]